MKAEELMIRDKHSGHRMSGWGRRRVIRGGSWGQGQLGGSAVVPSPSLQCTMCTLYSRIPLYSKMPCI